MSGKADLPQSAYQSALSSFPPADQTKLTKQDTLKLLFEQLNEADQAHHESSLMRRGLKRVKPFLERLNATIDFVSPFASMEPTAGTALGLVKGTATVAIAICGHFEDATKDIADFLEKIPVIDRASSVVRDGGPMQEIYTALVNIYEDLLKFYLSIMALFEDSKYVLRVALELFKPKIADIVSSFKSHVDALSRLLETENFASIQEIKDEQVETLIRDVLERNSASDESAYQNELQNRTDDACSWITSSSAFSYWLLSRDAKVLALFGDMGTGKTMTTAFVTDALAQTRRQLCAFYCKDEHELAKLGTIYRSFVLQLVRQSYENKMRFSKWYKETAPTVRGSPTDSDAKLRELLFELISSSRKTVFIVLDALDECKTHPRQQIFSLVQELLEKGAPLKVFVSSRYSEAIQENLHAGFTSIEMRASQDRDRFIAAHLVSQTELPQKLHQKVVDELAPRAQGSAIWLRIAVRYIERTCRTSARSLEKALAQLPSSQGLTALYGQLFSKICDGIPENEAVLQLALDILAVAQRPLTPDELAYAVFTKNPVDEEDQAATIKELGELAQDIDVFKLVRPFVTVMGGREPRLRLVHQSLKELVLTAPPSKWCVSPAALAKLKKGERAADLDADLLHRCIAYLLFDECDEKSLFPDVHNDAGEADMLAVGGTLDFDDEEEEEEKEEEAPADLNPSRVGLGSFYAYAAAFWTGHFSVVSPELRPDAAKLVKMCFKDSRRLANWLEQWRRPNCSFLPEREWPGYYVSGMDPLIIAARFGPAESIVDVFLLTPGSPAFHKDSIWTAVKLLIQGGNVALLKSLVQNEAVQPILCRSKFFYATIDAPRWSKAAPWDDGGPATKDWEDIFGFLIGHLRDELLGCGNDILRRAARGGTLILIKQLLAAADKDPELLRILITPGDADDEERVYKGRGFYGEHQSIGEAAYEGQGEVVRLLCEHPGIGPAHLPHVSAKGDTVFHQAARRPRVDVLRTLIRHWPEGVNVANNSGDLPLLIIVYDFAPLPNSRVEEFVRLLLCEGGADAKACENGTGSSALCNAVRGGGSDVLLRLLVEEGRADIWEALEVDEATGKPKIKKGVDTWYKEERREQMLELLCSMLPKSVAAG
ncbi:hypothetical protein C8A05DRAFT_41489 [Staphylotrichum tortipilum]|uniref:Nephrocystin 3-like N-terminal domain-containing protein n=1 Tax=Staphylotrichum tortipilum TaxID=2831512 RepID=A0AAN6RW33_9PEZI|nr:hypothetical protein C8A05DRAFT_41489 [Staphylotrichum longicolle]